MLSLADSIVFTGISGCFGNAPTPRAFWKSILRKQSAFVALPVAADGHTADELFPGHPLPEVIAALGENFSCQSDRISLPPDLGIGDNPDFWFAAQLMFDALDDAQLSPLTKKTDRIALFMGYDATFNPASVNWLWHANVIAQVVSTLQRFFPNATHAQMGAIRENLIETLPLLKPRHLRHARGDGIARKLAQTFTACDSVYQCTAGEASVFAALEAASNALRLNQCDVAVVLTLQPPISQTQLVGESCLLPFSHGRMLLPFTDNADGTLPGEGGAAFVLQRLSDARKSTAKIYAKLHGCALIAGISPKENGLEESLRRCLHRALRRLPNGFRDVDYWEMNASGVPEEDAAEETLLNRITTNRGANLPLLALGSAKTTFGHTLTAAGALGVLKGVLAISHKILPPSITPIDETFRLCKPEHSYYWVQEARPWIAASTRPRRLAVSTLSRIGRAGAAILEEVNE
jgi:acyl transferase domain-containing protein